MLIILDDLKRSSFFIVLLHIDKNFFICYNFCIKGCETMIDLEENKRKLMSIQEKIKSIGDSL